MIIECLLQRTEARIATIRDAMASLYAVTVAGSPSAVREASDMLAQAVSAARPETARLARLLNRLDAPGTGAAASMLCSRGRRDAAHRLLRVRALVVDVARTQAGLLSFVQGCADPLRRLRAGTASRRRDGHVLGRA